jgi:hypothetical protein
MSKALIVFSRITKIIYELMIIVLSVIALGYLLSIVANILGRGNKRKYSRR